MEDTHGSGRMRNAIRAAAVLPALVLALTAGTHPAGAHGPSQLPPPPGETSPVSINVEHHGPDRSRDLAMIALGAASVAAGMGASRLYGRRHIRKAEASSSGDDRTPGQA